MNKYISNVLTSGSWSGRRCFLVGGGPSLQGVNPRMLDNELSIGINKAFVKFNCTINYAMDMRFFQYLTRAAEDIEIRKTQDSWRAYTGIKLFLEVAPKFDYGPGILAVRRLVGKQICLDLSRGIYSGSNSGFGALMLALSLGANPIHLLGYDMKVDLTRDKTHWHSGYPNQTSRLLQRKLDRFRIEFNEFAPRIADLGITVCTIGLDSALECFPKTTSEEVLNGMLAGQSIK